MGRHKFGYVQWSIKIRSRSENDTDNAEMVYVCVKFLYKKFFSL